VPEEVVARSVQSLESESDVMGDLCESNDWVIFPELHSSTCVTCDTLKMSVPPLSLTRR